MGKVTMGGEPLRRARGPRPARYYPVGTPSTATTRKARLRSKVGKSRKAIDGCGSDSLHATGTDRN
jgi:hypothetical protein